ncbi:aminotransferase class I/II-fold pyridoxal phosphate-dependent enzyme [Telmatobacter bradus]|uniref:aminotransferase class I/II-fold pyridoxal phosphate-dependent enzyme n=1 Tax=Telmatobacter bradus TaxID=474953 RepID=UPI003B439BCC
MRVSQKAAQFTESVIRDMTRQAIQHGAVNLAQGFPDFAAPEVLKTAAQQAVAEDVNQYAITWGAKNFRQALAEKFFHWQGFAIDPEREITVCCGSTEAMIATQLALINPGEEVIVFEPFYENYGPDAILSGAVPRYVTLHAPTTPDGEWYFDEAELRAAFNAKTRAIILNTPHNPTGKVFTRTELELIRDLCVEHDVLAITDEIYEHILYDGTQHISPATLDGMRERTISINSLSKSYSVTGWRVGWAIAPPEMTAAIRKVHDFLTVGAAAPLQAAGAVALRLPESYYAELAAHYGEKRDLLLAALRKAGFTAFRPQGAYYIMTDIAGFGAENDRAFAHHLVKEDGVATVPGSSFYSNPAKGATQIRFAFCKKIETLQQAIHRLARL